MSMFSTVSALPLLLVDAAPDLALFIGHYWMCTAHHHILSDWSINSSLHHGVVSPWIVITSYAVLFQSQRMYAG